jgi:trk system potassium uptake protein TrkH
MIQYKVIGRVIGYLILLLAVLLVPSIGFSIWYAEGDLRPLLLSFFLFIITGVGLSLMREKKEAGVKKREGYLIVAFGWIAMGLFGSLPYWLSQSIPHFHDALFESISGLTTTGATILEDIESVSKGILTWRSTTQWIGGMGIIVLTVALFPLLGIGGIELFVAEAPGPTSDKVHPRIKETAKRLWLVYVGLTLVVILLYWWEGMTFFDAFNHGLTTISSGGFSTKNQSMAFFTSPLIQYTCIVFMFLSGVNFSLTYYSLVGKPKRMFSNEEFKIYFLIVLFLSIYVSIGVLYTGKYSYEEAFRTSLFQVLSLITTTGYVTDNYTEWSAGLSFVFFLLLFSGGSAGSTSGGIKIIRHIVFFKHSLQEFKRLLHPQAILPLKINKTSVNPKIVHRIITFLLVYLFILFVGVLVLSINGIDLQTSMGAVATSLGNVGPAIGQVGPMDNFAWLSPGIKIFLAFLMLIGRLELFTILIIFTPYFWKNS